MKNLMNVIGNIYVAGIYAMKDEDGIVRYVGSGINCNDRLSSHLYFLKRNLYKGTNKEVLQDIYDRGQLTFEIIKISESNNEVSNMTIEQKKSLQEALGVLEEFYIGLYKESIINRQMGVTKHSSNKDEYSTTKRRIANTGIKNPNNKYDSSMISEILWFKLHNYKPKTIKELIENYYKIDMNKSYIGQIGVQKWIDLIPTLPIWFNESEVM